MRPTLFIEHDAGDGFVYIRVQEQTYDPFAPGTPQRIIADKNFGPAAGTNNDVTGNLTTLIRNVNVVQMEHALDIFGNNTTSIYNYTDTQFSGDGSIFGAAIKLGDQNQPNHGGTYIQRVTGDGKQAPDATYTVSNTDFIGIEVSSGPIYVRDVTGRNWGDAGIDTKSTGVYVMNATLQSGNRMLDVWPGVDVVLVNTIVNAAAGHSQAWLSDNTSSIHYYNTIWCYAAAAPSASSPDCSTSPNVAHIEGENITSAQAAARIFPLSSNPLEAVSPFFHSQVEHIVLQYSDDNGATWHDMSVPNTGGAGSAPIGDTRYRIPLDLNAANYRFRAWYEHGGAKIGDTSLVIDETGNVVP